MCVKKYRDLWEAVITYVMQTLGQVPGLSQSTIDGNNQPFTGMGILDEDQSLAAPFDRSILSGLPHGTQSFGYSGNFYLQPDDSLSDYPDFNDELSQYAGLRDDAIFSDIQCDLSQADGGLRNKLPLKHNELMAEVQNVLSEDIWTGDKFGSHLLTELMSRSSGVS